MQIFLCCVSRSMVGLSRRTFRNCFCPSCCQSIGYLRAVAGCRTVPVEVGSRYTDEAWSQALITVNEFIDRYIVGEVCSVCQYSNLPSAKSVYGNEHQFYLVIVLPLISWFYSQGSTGKGYLAQHQLFDQV